MNYLIRQSENCYNKSEIIRCSWHVPIPTNRFKRSQIYFVSNMYIPSQTWICARIHTKWNLLNITLCSGLDHMSINCLHSSSVIHFKGDVVLTWLAGTPSKYFFLAYTSSGVLHPLGCLHMQLLQGHFWCQWQILSIHQIA
jgi:hypothetical protein